jgi:hypothetical protein
MSKDLKYTTWSSVFFAYINVTKRRLSTQEVCQVDITCKRQLKYYRQFLDEKSLFSSMQGTFHSVKLTKWRRRPYWVKDIQSGWEGAVCTSIFSLVLHSSPFFHNLVCAHCR